MSEFNCACICEASRVICVRSTGKILSVFLSPSRIALTFPLKMCKDLLDSGAHNNTITQ